jgi:rhodanese-related sulfurtransferase
LFAGGLGIALALRGWVSRRQLPGRENGSPWIAAAREMALILFVAIAAGTAYDWFDSAGLLRNASAVASVTTKFFENQIPEVTRVDVENAARTESAVIVDARSQEAYARGHVPGAISIPVAAGLFGHRRQLGSAPKNARILVYCQNTQCPWARDVAARLLADGFARTAVYPAGWEGWVHGAE